MYTWYGFQIYGTNSVYPKLRYIGGSNRAENIAIDGTKCGNNKATKFTAYGDTHKVEVEIDPDYDLGDRTMFNRTDNAIFSSTMGKVYFYIIEGNYRLETGCNYNLRGFYRFSPVN